MKKAPLSVTQLNQYIKNVFDDELLLHGITVYGEISGFSVRNTTAYFTLRDENAKIDCVFFKQNPNFEPKEGDKVQVIGTPRYYSKGGRLSFQVVDAKLFGIGEIFKRITELTETLQKEGLFDKKKPMPAVIKTIGVITSGEGAVIHDIINVTQRRNDSINLVLRSVKVQGEGAEMQIAKAIESFCKLAKPPDALIVARGGGSREELDTFNSEAIARAVANSKIFTVSAVGHETDTTLCDFAADLRAPTPSAAAELLTKDKTQQKRDLLALANTLRTGFLRHYAEKTVSLDFYSQKLLMLASHSNKSSYAELKYCKKRLLLAVEAHLKQKDSAVQAASALLEKNNPLKILERSYAKIYCGKKPVGSASELKRGDSLEIILKDGSVSAEVKTINANKA